MRKAALIAAGALTALTAAAVAIAGGFTASGVSATTATLNTTQATDVKTRTCTGGDNKTFTVTDARYTGSADFTNPGSEFDGPLTIRARTVVDTASKLGVVQGTFKVNDSDTRVSGQFWGTLDASGNISGFLTGGSHGNHATVLGTLGGTFSTGTGLTGKLGTAPLNPMAVVVGPVCRGEAKPAPTPKPKRFEIHGTLSAIGANNSSVTVTAKGPTTATCNTDASSPSLTGFAVNDQVEMTCEGSVSNNVTTWLLRGLKKESHPQGKEHDH